MVVQGLDIVNFTEMLEHPEEVQLLDPKLEKGYGRRETHLCRLSAGSYKRQDKPIV